MRILHCGDIHLSQKAREYSLTVLNEIGDIAREEACELVIIAGDLFDSFPDAEALRGDFKAWAASLSGALVLFLPGNHEELYAKDKPLSQFDFGQHSGNVRLLDSRPFAIHSFGGIEVVSIPYSPHYLELANAEIPKKADGVLRIVAAHDAVSGMNFIPQTEDNAVSGIVPEELLRFAPDYVALGHIHSGREERIGGALFSYPGSARVWRRGETGERRVRILEAGKTITVRDRSLKSAGEYRYFEIPLSLEGECGFSPEYSQNDLVDIAFVGVIEDEKALSQREAELKQKPCREIGFNRERVSVLSGISSHPLAKQFLQEIESLPADIPPAIVKEARQIGLLSIKDKLEARR